jgi:hypothetical protein
MRMDNPLNKEGLAPNPTSVGRGTIPLSLDSTNRNRQTLDLGALRGKIEFDNGYDYKAVRSR